MPSSHVFPQYLFAIVQCGPSSYPTGIGRRAYRNGSRLGAVSAARERTSASKTSPHRAVQKRHGPNRAAHGRLHSDRQGAPTSAGPSPAQPSRAARQKPAGHGDGRGSAPGLASLRTRVRQPQRPKRTNDAARSAPTPSSGLAYSGGRWLKQLCPGLARRLRDCRRNGYGTPMWHRNREPPRAAAP